jgi:hypothetical protein
MQKHQFSVGVLTELAPQEHPELLGLNVNSGLAIKLRLRTDMHDGFRLYKEIRRVLCHELSHNVWRDHGDNVRPFSFLSIVISLYLQGMYHTLVQGAQLEAQP